MAEPGFVPRQSGTRAPTLNHCTMPLQEILDGETLTAQPSMNAGQEGKARSSPDPALFQQMGPEFPCRRCHMGQDQGPLGSQPAGLALGGSRGVGRLGEPGLGSWWEMCYGQGP